MGLRFNACKTETYHLVRNYGPGTITKQGQQLTIFSSILTYLGHVPAHPSHRDTAWHVVTNQLRHDVAAYKALPLNGFAKVVITNAISTPCHTRPIGAIHGNRQRMAQWDGILEWVCARHSGSLGHNG